ncbi:MAG TPA: tRNA pseudouridine(13) synthase TruD [Steroidobacteraceae bacterium]|nr:tRNA pseudouridine(13) synthase TruD [Steroidobacteraceae bacterium]
MDAELSAREVALAPPRAFAGPVARGLLRAEPEDFVVEEDLGFAPEGSGQHLLLKVRKRNANTQWVARELARRAGCRVAEVGYAGLKDRRAVAVQWFSVPRPRVTVRWEEGDDAEFAVLEAHTHNRKLPRGALAGNHFAVRIRASDGDGAGLAALLAPRAAEIVRRGVPNYFGPQRFGRDGANLALPAQDLTALPPPQRGFLLSAARSVIFNAVLAARVTDGSWEQLLEGDLVNLEGRGSIFAVAETDADLAARSARLEIHPTGPLWGRGNPATRGRVLELELRSSARFGTESALCSSAGMRQERRSLRLAVHALRCTAESSAVMLQFRLTRGGFATAVLRELLANDEE